MEGIEVIETEWGSELHKRLIAENTGRGWPIVIHRKHGRKHGG